MKKFTSIYKKSKNISKQIEIEYFFVGVCTETPKKVKKFRNGLKLEKFGTPPHTETTCIYNIEKIWGVVKWG